MWVIILFLLKFLWDSNILKNDNGFQALFSTMLEFQRLEKLLFGGLRGRVYTEQVSRLYAEFLQLCKAIRDQEYNPLDLTSQVWLHGVYFLLGIYQNKP